MLCYRYLPLIPVSGCSGFCDRFQQHFPVSHQGLIDVHGRDNFLQLSKETRDNGGDQSADDQSAASRGSGRTQRLVHRPLRLLLRLHIPSVHLLLLAVHDVSSVHAHERVPTHALLRAFRHRCHENQSEDDGWHPGQHLR